MSNKTRLFSVRSAAGLAFWALILSMIACSSGQFLATATPYPTLTPYPTYTPNPSTATPVPARWEVKVVSAVKSKSFGEWYYADDVKSEYIIVTLEYTYRGDQTVPFSPQTVVLLFPDGSSWPGYALSATDYQPENTSKVTNFYNQGPILNYIKPGQTKVEKFGWGLTITSDTEYRLLFPETEPIDVKIGN